MKNKGNERTTTIFRVEKRHNYTPIHRYSAEDKRLSWEARGVLVFLLVKPDDWQVSLPHLINSGPSGRDKMRRILKELMENKYIVKHQNRTHSGQFSVPEYVVYELPYDGHFDSMLKISKREPKKSSMEKPLMELPQSSNHLQQNIQTKPIKQISNETTTNLIVWPKNLSEAHQTSIISLIKHLDYESTQNLVDELAGQLENIKNPVGYFRTLLQSYLSGSFIPAQAIKIQQQREQRNKNQQAIEHANRLAEERLQKQINEHMEKQNDAKTE